MQKLDGHPLNDGRKGILQSQRKRGGFLQYNTCTFPPGSSSTQAPSILLPCPCSFKCSAGCCRRRRPCCLLSTQSLLPFLLTPLQVQSPPPPFIPADCKRGFPPWTKKEASGRAGTGARVSPLGQIFKDGRKMNALLCVSAL